MKMENTFNTDPATLATASSHKHTDKELLDILRLNEELTPLEAFAKRKYATVLRGAILDDEKQSVETRAAENFVRPASLSSLAALRAVGAMKATKE